MGGLSIRYRSRKNNAEGLAELTIFTGNGRSVAGVTLSCKCVFDYHCELFWEGCDYMPPVRRCDVELENLCIQPWFTPFQQPVNSLNHFAE
ncbi:MAG TPA: hypothetical protein HPP81_08820 [Deltaproteobacteria bacterium]|nr:hypothetical protein [Deltaproteobacteria bacterium]